MEKMRTREFATLNTNADSCYSTSMKESAAERIQHAIAQDGQIVFGYLGNSKVIPHMHTVGNHSSGFPELLLLGTCSPEAEYCLVHLSRLMRHEGGFVHNQQIVEGDGVFKMIAASYRAQEEFTQEASKYYGHANYKVLQVLVPDWNGKYPGEQGCATPYDVPCLYLC